MGWFSKNDKDAYGEYMEPGAIPVATAVPEAHATVVNTAFATMSDAKDNKPPAVTLSHDPHDPLLIRSPMMMRQCPNCLQESRTRIKTYPTWQTWTAAGVLLFVFWPICWMPLVLDNCKQTDHFCVLCGAEVGQVAAFNDCCVERRG